MDNLVKKLSGPVCVLGSTGFVGTNLLKYLKLYRNDVHGSGSNGMWEMINEVKPRTIFNCIAYGAYACQEAPSLIYHTNFILVHHIMSHLSSKGFDAYVHAGSSSEYGVNKAFPPEETPLHPVTPYGVSKAAASDLVYYYGKTVKLPVCNLRIYCVYGPHEKPVHLIPTIMKEFIRKGKLPQFVRGDVSRDFIHVDDVCRAFVAAAVNLRERNYGEAFNIGTGLSTKISTVAEVARRSFGIEEQPQFTLPSREWDTHEEWAAQISKARSVLGWEPKIAFEQGFNRTYEWFLENFK